MKNDRYIISIAADEDPAIFSKKAKDGATVTMITARTFEEATFSRLLKGDAEP